VPNSPMKALAVEVLDAFMKLDAVPKFLEAML